MSSSRRNLQGKGWRSASTHERFRLLCDLTNRDQGSKNQKSNSSPTNKQGDGKSNLPEVPQHFNL